MWEFEIVNKEDGRQETIYGSWFDDTMRAYGFNTSEWYLVNSIYID